MPGKKEKKNERFPLCIVICNSQVFPLDCSCKLLHFIARKSDHLEHLYNTIVSIRVQLHRKLWVGWAKYHFLFYLTVVLIKWSLSVLLISLNLWGGKKEEWIFSWLRNPTGSIKNPTVSPSLTRVQIDKQVSIFSLDMKLVKGWWILGWLVVFFLFM